MAPDSTRPLDVADKTEGELELERIFTLQRGAYLQEPNPDYEARKARLETLIRAIEANEDKLVQAVNADFGNRASTETVLAEIIITVSAAKHAIKKLKSWMRPRKIATPMHLLPAKSRLAPQPLGVVGIVAPWNYPIQLALSPAIAALAAGNRVMLKPSELTPATSQALKDVISADFDEAVFAVVTGGVETGVAFSSTRFDHLLFTGSTAIGRRVAQAAARNLTPVTLELGGKSPVIIDPTADLEKAGYSIAQGKTFNAGQTCIAPDYVLVGRDRQDALVDAIVAGANKLYPGINATDDYTSVISDRHFERLQQLVEQARNAGVKIIEVGDADSLKAARKLPLTLVIDPPADLKLMQEEIFGPILPILSIDSAEQAIERINDGERPLALYWFGDDDAARDRILTRTISGGVTVNDTLLHVAQENLPFGGVGESGIGAYHGDQGFETFSHMKSIFYQSRFAAGGSLHPPYTEQTQKVLNLVRKIM